MKGVMRWDATIGRYRLTWVKKDEVEAKIAAYNALLASLVGK